ncbi:16S rRNA (cytosine(967)-C(5))-methyltransferase RsmB [Thalassotalea agariperforans]
MAANIRALAAKCTFNVVDKGRSLSEELPDFQLKAEVKDKALLQELCFGVLRYLPELENDVRQFIDKPLKGKQRVFHFLMLVGVYQIKYMRIPDHAALSETVNACKPLKNTHLKGLVNAVLRSFQRAQANNESQSTLPEPIVFNHPSWFINKVKAAYPEQWQNILVANLARPPMWLRVNQQHNSVAQYQQKLAQLDIEICQQDKTSGALLLTNPIDVNKLPQFSDGHVSVQDAAAQQAAVILQAQAGERILDCCAAPGGKTCHMLELEPSLEMTAIDVEAHRLSRVQENLQRLQLDAHLIAGDATQPDTWWDGKLYDRILLDAPCSATGVIRRHPDIKWLRKADDIEKLSALQQQILKNIWPLLKSGGTLLYATCSILPQENDQQIEQFLANNSDATLVKINDSDQIGWQILPSEQNMDGFYYAKLIKS